MRQIPDRKLLLRSVYDVLTQITNDFQQSLQHTQQYTSLLFPLIHFIPCQCRIVLFTYWAISDHVGPYCCHGAHSREDTGTHRRGR